MRILHLINSLSEGGAERQLSYLAPELVRMGHDVDIAYSHEGPDQPQLPGVSLRRLKSLSNHDPYLLWQLIRFIRHIKPDIIQTWVMQMDILGGMAAKLCGVPLIIREPSSGLVPVQRWKNYLRARVGSRACVIISNSRGGDEYWKTIMPDQRRFIISNGLPVDKIDKTEAAVPPDIMKQEAPIVLYVGRLEEKQKRPKLFLEALARVKKKKKVFGVLCGEGPLRSELERLTHELGLNDDILFTGHLAATTIWAVMKKSAALVSPSAYEGCPNAVMEAMACGCPLIISDIPSHRDMMDEKCALFVELDNVAQTADAIIKILDGVEDSKTRAAGARQKTLNWSIAEMARNYEKVYKRCL
ncbi:MAG TPA: glycosyltransferase [Smithella sp.]|nr:glycosyltransferase [Smithella sp.]